MNVDHFAENIAKKSKGEEEEEDFSWLSSSSSLASFLLGFAATYEGRTTRQTDKNQNRVVGRGTQCMLEECRS